MKTEETPEAKLLRLIKGGPSFRARLGGLARRLRGTGLWLGRVSPKAAADLFRWADLSPWQIANRVLLGLTSISLLALSLQAFLPASPPAPGIPAAPREQAAASPSPAKTIRLEEITRRNLFQSFRPTPPRPKIAATKAVKKGPSLRERVSTLRLVGIVQGGVLQAVIEDATSHTTRYVAAGDMLNEMRVEKISSDRVTLRLGEETVDIGL